MVDALAAAPRLAHQVRNELDVAPQDDANWPHAVRLSLRVKSKLDELVFVLRVSNTGDQSFNWTGGLHPYFAVQDVLTSSAAGLAGLGVQDRYDADVRSQPPGDLCWSAQPFERLYEACPPVLLAPGKRLRGACGFRSAGTDAGCAANLDVL